MKWLLQAEARVIGADGDAHGRSRVGNRASVGKVTCTRRDRSGSERARAGCPDVQDSSGDIDPWGASVVKVRNAIVIGALLVSLAALGAGPATAQSSNEKPQATEVGVTASEIHIAVVADVDNPFAPGLFKGAVDGVKAGAAYLNSKAGGGGLAGRKVVVDFYDSHLNPNESRNATIQGCENDYALVGTSALFLTQVEDIVNCKDQAGQATGIPDMSAVTTGVPESCSPMAFPAFGTPSTVPPSPRTRRPSTATRDRRSGSSPSTRVVLHGVTIVGNDTKDAARGGTIARPRRASRRASRSTRATRWSPCRDVTRRACSRPSCRR